ncbi:DUF6651 domain-containing protein [Methylocaldum szegediense]|uniref:DUF6651 domain-containing protein n=1 Tax=Methylocaldum szegediense TaxID=73780 RepID=UPI00042753D3|nr:DUF6651 domain-containing protein [Methylocaldum szegediense]
MNFRDLQRMSVVRGYWDKAGDDGTSAGGGTGDNVDNGGATQGGKTGKSDDGKGKSGISDREAELIKENMQKKAKIGELTAQIADLEAKLKAFDGIDLEQVKTLIEEKKEAERKQLEAKGEWDKLKEQLVTQHQVKEKELKSQLAARDAQIAELKTTIDNLTVGHAFDNSIYIKEKTFLTPTKARVFYGNYFEVENGQVIPYDKPRGAQGRTPLIDASGNALSFEDAIEKIIELDPEKDAILRSKMQPGAGSGTTLSRKAPDNPDKAELRGIDKIRIGLRERAKQTG